MQIDWTTFILEIINFLVLVWLLQHFLYRPILSIVQQRRQAIEQQLAKSQSIEANARALSEQYEQRIATWEQEKNRERVQFDRMMDAERTRQLQALQITLEEEKSRQTAIVNHQQQALQRELEMRALNQAQRFTANLLHRLASPELQTRLVDLFLDDWTILSEQQLANLTVFATTSDSAIHITSAFPLTPEQRQHLQSAIDARLHHPKNPVLFSEDNHLLAGLRLSIGAWQLQMNLADELAGFFAAANHVE